LPGSVTVGAVTVGAGGGGGTLGVLTLGGFGALPVEGTLGVLTLGTVGVGVSDTDGTVGVTSEVEGTVGVETVGVCGSAVVGAVGVDAVTVGGFTLGAGGEIVWFWGGFGFGDVLGAAPPPVGCP
jgi:hypothetical protein